MEPSSTTNELIAGWSSWANSSLTSRRMVAANKEPSANLLKANDYERLHSRSDDLSAEVRERIASNARVVTQLSYRSSVGGLPTQITSSTDLSSMVYGIVFAPLQNEELPERIGIATNMMRQAMQITSDLYRDVMAKCQSIIVDTDLSDIDEKNSAVSRLTDVLEPFNTVISRLFSDLLASNRGQPVAMSFLLGEVMLNLDGLQSEARLMIIRSFTNDATPSLRFAAVRALDNLGVSQAKQLLASLYSTEQNSRIKKLIESSLANV